MINYNNHNITGITYNNHSIKYVYGCGGNLVWSGETPPVFDLKLYAEYTTSETLEIECNGQRLDPLEPQHGGDPDITYMEKVYIGGCAKSIPQNTFSNMAINLKEVIMYDGITTIYNNSFSELYKLSKVTIPSSVTSIGSRAFYGCSGLTSITVEAITPPTLGSGAFNGSSCPIYVPCQSVDAYKAAWSQYADRIACVEPAFDGKFKATYSGGTYSGECNSYILSNYDFTGSPYPVSSMTSCYVGDCVTELENSLFNNLDNLTSVTFSNNLQIINSNCFSSSDIFKRLNSDVDGVVNIPSGVTTIGGQVLQNLSAITTANISDTVQSIGRNFMVNCNALETIIVGSGITSIGGGFLESCSSLSNITIKATVPPTIDIAVYGSNSCPIYVPSESVEAYKTATNWTRFASRIQPIP